MDCSKKTKNQLIVPFKISGEEFNKMFVLVDGIYMNCSRFVKGIKIPLTNEEAKFIKWQEGVRKDIEHAFGNLKILWKFGLKDIADQITTSLILHKIVMTN